MLWLAKHNIRFKAVSLRFKRISIFLWVANPQRYFNVSNRNYRMRLNQWEIR